MVAISGGGPGFGVDICESSTMAVPRIVAQDSTLNGHGRLKIPSFDRTAS